MRTIKSYCRGDFVKAYIAVQPRLHIIDGPHDAARTFAPCVTRGVHRDADPLWGRLEDSRGSSEDFSQLHHGPSLRLRLNLSHLCATQQTEKSSTHVLVM